MSRPLYPAPEPSGYPAGYPPGPEFVGPEPTEEEERLMAEQREEEQEAYWERLSDCNRVVGSVSVGLAVVLCWRGACCGQAACPSWARGVTLGAVFAPMYGPVRALMSEDEKFRFVGVVAAALGFVYRRFIRSGGGSPA